MLQPSFRKRHQAVTGNTNKLKITLKSHNTFEDKAFDAKIYQRSRDQYQHKERSPKIKRVSVNTGTELGKLMSTSSPVVLPQIRSFPRKPRNVLLSAAKHVKGSSLKISADGQFYVRGGSSSLWPQFSQGFKS